LSATIVFPIVRVPRLSTPPLMLKSAEFALTVELVSVSALVGSELEIPPPNPSLAELPLTVELMRVSVP
jgi:hypothetical protein